MAIYGLVIKRGDTRPAFQGRCLDGVTPVDLSGATARLLRRLGAVALPALALTIPVGTDGLVKRDWVAGDLADAGVWQAEVEVTWPSGGVQTFPADGYVTIHVVADLG
jgi:hypothetical protein